MILRLSRSPCVGRLGVDPLSGRDLNPDFSVAVRDEHREWSYGALNGAADRVAAALAPILSDAGGRVALLLDHDATMIAAILGVLKAGGAYVPLDPGHPAERLSLIVEDSLACAVLTNAPRYGCGTARMNAKL